LATDAARRTDHVRALSLLEESLALRRKLGDPAVIATSLYTVALSALALGDEERARDAFTECLQLAPEIGHLMLIGPAAANWAISSYSADGPTEPARFSTKA
jgi:hypothetical protein